MRRFLLLAGLLLLWTTPAQALDPWAGCQFLFAGAGITITCPDTITGGATIVATGSPADIAAIKFWVGDDSATVPAAMNLGALTSGLVLNSVAGGVGTPSAYTGTACGASEAIAQLNGSGSATCISIVAGSTSGVKFWVAEGDAVVPNAEDLGALTTGLVLNTVTGITGVPSAYAGTSCTNQFPRSLNASGAATCASVANADLANAGFTLNGTSNQINTTDATIDLGGTATLSLSSTLVAPGSVTVTTRSGTPSTVATFTSGGVLAEGASAVNTTRRVCAMIVGADNGSVLVDADLGPQGRQCFIPAAATVVEVNVAGNDGTPNVIPRRNRAGSGANFVSGALATAASGGIACSNTGGTTGIDGATTCTNTLQNTSLNAGDYIELISGTAGGVAKRMSVFVIYTIN